MFTRCMLFFFFVSLFHLYDDGCRTEIFAKCRIGVGVLRSKCFDVDANVR